MVQGSMLRAFGLAAAFVCAGSALAGAQSVPQAALATPAAASAEVPGFRSAKFGMEEAALRKAVAGDFNLKAAKLAESENPAERTKILSIRVPDVLEGGGVADVSYVLGHKSKALTQVSVLWSADADPKVDGAKLVANGNLLRNYFLSAGYVPDSVVTDVPVPEGLLMFRGSDAKGRMAVLLLRGSYSAAPAPAAKDAAGAAPAAQPVLTPTSLLLAYIADPKNPDVFALKPGQF